MFFTYLTHLAVHHRLPGQPARGGRLVPRPLPRRLWRYVAIGLLVFHFFFPFLILLHRSVKRRAATLGGGRRVRARSCATSTSSGSRGRAWSRRESRPRPVVARSRRSGRRSAASGSSASPASWRGGRCCPFTIRASRRRSVMSDRSPRHGRPDRWAPGRRSTTRSTSAPSPRVGDLARGRDSRLVRCRLGLLPGAGSAPRSGSTRARRRSRRRAGRWFRPGRGCRGRRRAISARSAPRSAPRLDGWGWVDRERGIAHVPVEQRDRRGGRFEPAARTFAGPAEAPPRRRRRLRRRRAGRALLVRAALLAVALRSPAAVDAQFMTGRGRLPSAGRPGEQRSRRSRSSSASASTSGWAPQLPLDRDVPRRDRQERAPRRLLRLPAGRAGAGLLPLPAALHARSRAAPRWRLKPLDLVPGRDFEVVFVSFDPVRHAGGARRRRRPRRSPTTAGPETAAGWHFLTGDEESIARASRRRSASATRSTRSPGSSRTPSGLVVATPDGRVSRYLYGVEYAPRDLQAGAGRGVGEGKIGGAVEQAHALCFQLRRRRSASTPRPRCSSLRIAAALTVLAASLSASS